MSDSVQPHRRQPTRLPRSWDSPGKNTGVVYHFLLQCMKVKIESEVAQSCPTLRDPMDCSLPGSSVHRIFQVRVLEWVTIAFSIINNWLFSIWDYYELNFSAHNYTCLWWTQALISLVSIGEGNGNPLQYSCLENPLDGEPGRLQSMGSRRVGHD